MRNLANISNECKVTVYDEQGNFLRESVQHNITCNAGRASLVQRLYDDVTSGLWVIKYIAIGDDATPAASITDTILNNETKRELIITASTIQTTTSVKVYARFPTGYATTILEAGVFVDATSTATLNTGNLLCHSILITPISKASNEAVTIEWTIAINNATV